MLRLKELRAKFNFTQKELAERLEISQQAIAKWEKGTAEPTVKNLRELAIIFGGSTVIIAVLKGRKVKLRHIGKDGTVEMEII